MQVLTDALVSKLAAPASGRIEVADARCIGLTFRVTKAGARSFSFRFRPKGGGEVSRVTLGTYPDLSLAKARVQADKMREAVVLGNDPAADRREQRTGGRTFAGLASRYLAEHAERHKRPASIAADKRNLRLHVLPKWSKRDYRMIRRGDAIALVEGLVSGGKPTLANRVQALVSKVFSFAVDAELRPDNPCARMARRGTERKGRRVLSDDELPLFWHGIAEPKTARRTGLGLRLALLTGTRVGEVAGLSRVELVSIESPAGAAWVLPGERTKNKRGHLIPLCPLARQTVLDLLAMIEATEPYLLPTRSRERSGPMRPNSLTQAMAYLADKIECDTWKVDPPSPHDLRRTVETRLAGAGIPKEIRDHVLNHAPQGIGDKHYNLHDYAIEKRAALARWESVLTAILAGSTVIALADRRAAQ